MGQTRNEKTKKMIKVTLPDGAVRDYEDGASPYDVAVSISNSLAKKALAAKVNGELYDLTRPLEGDVELALITAKDEEGLELIRHDAAHVLAQAVQDLFPGTQVTIGPVIDDGFYYDFAREEPFSSEDFEKIEKKMAEIIDADYPIVREVWEKKRRSRRSNRSARITKPRSLMTSFHPASRSRFISKATGSICVAVRTCRAQANCPKHSS